MSDLEGRKFNTSDYDRDMSPEECIRWLYRHQAGVSVDRDEDGNDILTVIAPINHPEGQTAKAFGQVRSQAEAIEKFQVFVEAVSKQFSLE